MPRSFPITLRLTLFFTVTMAIVLYCVSGLLYATLRTQLKEKDQHELHSTLRFQQEIATSFSEHQGSQAWQKELFEFIVRRERLSLRIISPDGKIYAQSQNMGEGQYLWLIAVGGFDAVG